MTEQLASIKERHVEYDLEDGYSIICYQDSQPWPCDAAQLLTALAEAEAAVVTARERAEALEEDRAELREKVKAVRTVPVGSPSESDPFAAYLLGRLDTLEAVLRLIDETPALTRADQ